MQVLNVAEQMRQALTNAIQASLTEVFGRMCLEPDCLCSHLAVPHL